MSVRGTASILIDVDNYRDIDLGRASLPINVRERLSLTNGTNTGQADIAYTDTVQCAASSSQNLDLAGSLVDAFGATLTFVKLKLLYVKARATNVNTVQLSRPASNGVPLFLAASDAIILPPGAGFLWECGGAGVTVTASTGDILTLTNGGSGTAVDSDVVIIGTSA